MSEQSKLPGLIARVPVKSQNNKPGLSVSTIAVSRFNGQRRKGHLPTPTASNDPAPATLVGLRFQTTGVYISGAFPVVNLANVVKSSLDDSLPRAF